MSTEAYTEIRLGEEPVYLLAQKALYRPLSRQLVVSDIHLGKATHFRKMGIAMPDRSYLRDIDLLDYLLRTWKPQSLLILGDLFHSTYNREWLWFKALVLGHPGIRVILVEGNHDILHEDTYRIPNFRKVEYWEEPHAVFTHHPLKTPPKLNVCGHIHPGIRLSGPARQSITLPCFYQSDTHFILPAFGNLTGLFLLEPEAGAVCYIVVENTVRRV